MILANDDFLLASDELNDTLAAARSALEVLAAAHLPFAALARVHRESTRNARAWVLKNVDLSPFPEVPADQRPTQIDADDGLVVADHADLVEGDEPRTEEVDRETGDDLADLADIEEIDTRGGDDLVHFDDEGGDALVSFDDPRSDDDDALDDAQSMDDQELAALISYEEDFDVDVDEDLGIGDEESIGDDPSPGDLSSLVVFEEETPVLTLGGGDGRKVATPAPTARVSRPEADDEDSGLHDGTLVTDLEELVKLEDLLSEQVATDVARRQSTPRPPERQVVPPASTEPKVRVAATLTDEDLGLLGFNSQRELVSPEGSDADPASETGNRKAIAVPRGPTRRDDARTIEPIASSNKARAAVTPTSASTATPGPARALDALPTIRDQQDRPAAATARAAIRLEPGGASTVVQPQDDLLALDGADDEDMTSSGFSLEVEEYEFEEEDNDDVIQVGAAPITTGKIEVAAAPAAAPRLSNDQRSVLIRTARSAADRGDFSTAANLYADVLDYDPDNLQALVGRGRAYLDLGDYARAMSDFTVAAEIAPDDPDTNAAIGKLYYDRKDYTRAIEYLDRTLKRDAKHAMAWCWRGIAQYYRKDYAAAHDDLVHAQKLDAHIPNIGTYISMVKKKRK